VVDWNLKTYNNRVRKQETTLRLHGWVSSLLQARPSLCAGHRLNRGIRDYSRDPVQKERGGMYAEGSE
jgi:hypothetical protein